MHPNIFRYISTYILPCAESKKGKKQHINYGDITNAKLVEVCNLYQSAIFKPKPAK